MTREELRQAQIDNDDQIRTELGGLVWKRLTRKQQIFVICGRDLLANPTVEEQQIVNSFLDIYVARINSYTSRNHNELA